MAKNTAGLASRAKEKDADEVAPGMALFNAVSSGLMRSQPTVERVKLFGYDCIRTSGKVFAKLSKGRLVLKLPATRIASLILAGHVLPYEGARGEMKEWATLIGADTKLAIALAEESRNFVS